MSGKLCAFLNCNNSKRKSPEIAFFTFPRSARNSEDKLTKWIENSDLPTDKSQEFYTSQLVCGMHFEQKCFTNSLCKRLVHDAFPTIKTSKLENSSQDLSTNKLLSIDYSNKSEDLLNNDELHVPVEGTLTFNEKGKQIKVLKSRFPNHGSKPTILNVKIIKQNKYVIKDKTDVNEVSIMRRSSVDSCSIQKSSFKTYGKYHKASHEYNIIPNHSMRLGSIDYCETTNDTQFDLNSGISVIDTVDEESEEQPKYALGLNDSEIYSTSAKKIKLDIPTITSEHNDDIKDKIEELRLEVEFYKKQCLLKTKTIERLKNTSKVISVKQKTLEELINECSVPPQNQILAKMQLQLHNIWTEEEKQLSLSLHTKFPVSLKYIRDKMNLRFPSDDELNYWVEEMNSLSV